MGAKRVQVGALLEAVAIQEAVLGTLPRDWLDAALADLFAAAPDAPPVPAPVSALDKQAEY